jgi:hypothetical protein
MPDERNGFGFRQSTGFADRTPIVSLNDSPSVLGSTVALCRKIDGGARFRPGCRSLNLRLETGDETYAAAFGT